MGIYGIALTLLALAAPEGPATAPERPVVHYEFVSQNARAPIAQMVDPQYTVLVRIPKSRLPVAVPSVRAPGPR